MREISLQICSDLHLEAPAAYDVFEIPPKAPILALLGDIGQTCDTGWRELIIRQLHNFDTVLLVLGNHEPYQSDWQKARDCVKEIKEQKSSTMPQGNLVLLDRTRVDLSDDLTVLGCTLHSAIDPQHEESVSFGLNDFYYIQGGWDTSKHTQTHKEDVAWLNEQVTSIEKSSPHRRIAILTHHSPTTAPESIDPKYAAGTIASAFATDLSSEPCWKSQNVKLWAFGHTHFNCDFLDVHTKKRVVTNQRGYYVEQVAGFDVQRVYTF